MLAYNGELKTGVEAIDMVYGYTKDIFKDFENYYWKIVYHTEQQGQQEKHYIDFYDKKSGKLVAWI